MQNVNLDPIPRPNLVPQLCMISNAKLLLEQALEREVCDESSGDLLKVTDDRGKQLDPDIVRVDMSHRVGTSGQLSWDQYKTQLMQQTRDQYRLRGLPQKSDPIGQLDKILEAGFHRRSDGKFVLRIIPNVVHIEMDDVALIKETGELCSTWYARTERLDCFGLPRHLTHLKRTVMSRVNRGFCTKYQKCSSPSEKLKVIGQYLAMIKGKAHFRFSEKWNEPMDQICCYRNGCFHQNGMLTLAQLWTELTLQQIELPHSYNAVERISALLELEDGDLIRYGAIEVDRDKVYFNSHGMGEYILVLDKGDWTWDEHMSWLQQKAKATQASIERRQSAQQHGQIEAQEQTVRRTGKTERTRQKMRGRLEASAGTGSAGPPAKLRKPEDKSGSKSTDSKDKSAADEKPKDKPKAQNKSTGGNGNSKTHPPMKFRDDIPFSKIVSSVARHNASKSGLEGKIIR